MSMRVLLTALALMAFAFVLNLMGDLSVASSSTGPVLRGTTSVRVAIEPTGAPVERPVVRNVPRAKEIPAAPVRAAMVEKPTKVVLMKSTGGSAVLARATPEAAKFAAAAPKTLTAKASGLVTFDRA